MDYWGRTYTFLYTPHSQIQQHFFVLKCLLQNMCNLTTLVFLIFLEAVF